ncbi:MAG TPA: hypothetical protein VJH68_02420 [Candidatus Nanoarchaeia archaeon]|nr:hypothetical protein [Candidatus Nanoarchaeia archaeon]
MYQLKFEFYGLNAKNEGYISTVISKPDLSLTEEQLQAIEQLKRDYDQLLRPQKECLVGSGRVTAADLSVIINSPDK